VPRAGRWRIVLDTSDGRFAGWQADPPAEVVTESVPWHGFDHSIVLDLWPLAVVWLTADL
jgi:1,4-alpha-glucan branching enzyme